MKRKTTNLTHREFSKRKMYQTLLKEYFWFYKESISFMGHQSKVKTFFQSIPKSFQFIKEQYNHYKQYL